MGTGIYALTGNVAGVIGGALWVPFLGAFVVAFLTAFSYLELVGKYPRAAGAALYTNRAFRIPFLTFIVVFAVMSSGITSASSAAVAFGDTYLRAFVALPTWAVGITFVVLLGLINFRGGRGGAQGEPGADAHRALRTGHHHRDRGVRRRHRRGRAEPAHRDRHL